MDPKFKADLAKCIQPADKAVCLPPFAYTSEQARLAEQSDVFDKAWISLGRADRFKEVGAFETFDVLGHALLIIRGKDGTLRVLANTCRHRGARLVSGSGTCGGLRCPFHSWAYKLDGTLAAAPKMDEVAGFEKSDFNLITYQTEERFGFLFVFLGSGNAPKIDQQLSGFSKLHSAWPMDTMVSTRRVSMEVNCNWKAFLEVFNEYYHLPFVHPNSVDAVYNLPDAPDEVTGAFATQFGSTEGTGGLLQDSQDVPLPDIPNLSGKEANGVRYTWVFPNMTFAAGTDALWVYEAYPLTADTCLVFQTACFPVETTQLENFEELVQPYYHRLDAAIAEDIPALENQHLGFKSPRAVQGPFQPNLEPNVAAFARWYAQALLAD